MEAELGFERSKALFDMAEDAKAHLLGFAKEHDIDIELHARASCPSFTSRLI